MVEIASRRVGREESRGDSVSIKWGECSCGLEAALVPPTVSRLPHARDAQDQKIPESVSRDLDGVGDSKL